MRKHWAVTITAEHEWLYGDGAVAINTITVERQVQGDDEVCDALWAATQTRKELQTQYGITDHLHVTNIEIREVD